jgi:hypothetical protein
MEGVIGARPAAKAALAPAPRMKRVFNATSPSPRFLVATRGVSMSSAAGTSETTRSFKANLHDFERYIAVPKAGSVLAEL